MFMDIHGCAKTFTNIRVHLQTRSPTIDLRVLAALYAAPQAWGSCRRNHPMDHPMRTDPRWLLPETLPPPRARTNGELREQSALAARAVSAVQAHTGTKVALQRLGKLHGVNGASSTTVLPWHDELRANPFDGMHLFSVAGLRVMDWITGADGARLDPVLKTMDKAAAAAKSKADAAAPAAARAAGAASSSSSSGVDASARGKPAATTARKRKGGTGAREGSTAVRKRPKAAPSGGPASGKSGPAANVFEYEAVVGHADDVHGERESYHVRWRGGECTWEPAAEFKAKAGRSEGLVNKVTMYELSLVCGLPNMKALHDFLTLYPPLQPAPDPMSESAERLRDGRLAHSDLVEMDAALNLLPYNPETLPWRARHPLTYTSRLKMHDVHAWITSSIGEFQVRGRWKPETGRIVVQWLRAMTALYSPVLTLNTIDTIESNLFDALSEMEMILPKTDLSILMLHAPGHLPQQMRFLGPLTVHDMWGFEGCEFPDCLIPCSCS